MAKPDIPRQTYDVITEIPHAIWNAGILHLHDHQFVMYGNTERGYTKWNGVFLRYPRERMFVPIWHATFSAGLWYDMRLIWYRARPYAVFYDKNDEFRAFPRILRLTLTAFSLRSDHTCDFCITKSVPIHRWPSYSKTRPEKNWMPFVIHDRMHVVYSVQPVHRVLYVDPCAAYLELVSEWPWSTRHLWHANDVYGNTNAVDIDDGMLTFVHTKLPRRYITWYYVFSKEPPFKPLAYSSVPVFYPELSTEPRASKRVRRCFDPVFFPVGAVRISDEILVSYGENDAVQRVAAFSLRDLRRFLVPC